jgi:hypothetical protein
MTEIHIVLSTPDVVLSAYVIPTIFLTTFMRNVHIYRWETEAQKGEVTYQHSHSPWAAETGSGFEQSRRSGTRVLALHLCYFLSLPVVYYLKCDWLQILHGLSTAYRIKSKFLYSAHKVIGDLVLLTSLAWSFPSLALPLHPELLKKPYASMLSSMPSPLPGIPFSPFISWHLFPCPDSAQQSFL